MLPLSRIADLRDTVGPDWTSPVADLMADAWGIEPGTAKFWRSSASHVFAVAPAGAYLRMIPADHRDLAELVAVTGLMAALADAGRPVAAPVAGSDGELVQTRTSGLGRFHAVLVRALPGDQIDDDDATPEVARSWGAQLAQVHGWSADGLPPRELMPTGGGDDAELDRAVVTLRKRVDAVTAPTGLVHGDFELDNLRWEDGTPACFDFDEAGVGDQLADIALATRAIRDRAELRAAFLDGYTAVRPLAPQAAAALPAYDGLAAARTVLSINRTLRSEPRRLADDDPLQALQSRLLEVRALEHSRALGIP